MNKKILYWALAATAAIGAGVVYLLPTSEPADNKAEEHAKRPTAKRRQGKSKPARASEQRALRLRSPSTVSGKSFNDDEEEYPDLSPEMRKVMKELQDALDRDDFKSVSRLCENILRIQRKEGEAAVPKEVREKAVEALGLFLPESLAELIGFMADSDPEVLEAVIEQLDTVLNDTTIGDRDLSPLLTNMAKVLKDDDAIDSLAMTIESNMRNSVMVATYKEILKSGSAQAKTRIRESIADCMEVDVQDLPSTDVEISKSLDEWLQQNPDDEDDEEFYAGT